MPVPPPMLAYPVPNDDISSVVLQPGQYLCNMGQTWPRTKPLKVIGIEKDGFRAISPLVLHRPQATDPHGQLINLSLHGMHVHDVTCVGSFECGLYNAGVEEVTITNFVNDAAARIAKCIWTTVPHPLLNIPVPHGPTLSGGYIQTMRLYGPGGIGFLGIGELTDLLFGQLSIAGTGPARMRFHTVAPYQWDQWTEADKTPVKATSEGRPKRVAMQDTRMSSEGAYGVEWLYTRDSSALVYPKTIKTALGTNHTPVTKTQGLGLAVPG